MSLLHKDEKQLRWIAEMLARGLLTKDEARHMVKPIEVEEEGKTFKEMLESL